MSRPGSDYAKRKSKVASNAPVPQNVEFYVGPPKRPDIQHDNGFLDKFAPRKPTTEDALKYWRWQGKLSDGKIADFFGIRNLPDALPAYEHFLKASGKDRHFSYSRFVHGDPSG